MLTVTLNSNLNQFTVVSTNYNASNTSVKLLFSNCQGAITEYTVPNAATTFSIASTDPRFADNVYTFQMTITTSTGAKIVETKCYVIKEELKCDSLEFFKNKDIEKSLMYLALDASNNCINCSCTSLCEIYSKLTTTTCNDYSTNCGSTCNKVCTGCN